jgi:NitT/TauT family transport system substrate-binding protein
MLALKVVVKVMRIQNRNAISTGVEAAGVVARLLERASLTLLILCLAAAGMCGCDATKRPPAGNPGPGASGERNATNGSAPDRVTLMLNWYPEAEHGGFYAAKVHGIFAKYGLDVEIRPGGENAPVAQELVSGRVQFAIGNADDVLLFREQGVDVVALLAPIQQTPRCIMVRADSGIDSLSQLKGLTLQANRGQAFLSFMETRGMLEGVQVVPYSGSVARFVADDKTAIQAYNFSEPQLAEQKGVKAKALMLSEIGFNPYASCLLATGAEVKQRQQLSERMVQACREGWQMYLQSPAETNAAILAMNPERMTAEALAYGAEKLKPLCQPIDGETSQIGSMARSRWEELLAQFTELKLVTRGKVEASSTFIELPAPAASSAPSVP